MNKTQYFGIIIMFQNTFLGTLGYIFSTVSVIELQDRNILSVRRLQLNGIENFFRNRHEKKQNLLDNIFHWK